MLSITYSHDGLPPTTIIIDETAQPQAQTAAIQSALDAVAGRSGGRVTLSEGTFTLAGTGVASDGCLRVGSNTTLEGAGMGQTVLKLADGFGTVTGIVRTDSGQTLPDGTVKVTEHVLIRDITIDGNKANTTGEVDGFYCGPKPNSAVADSDIALSGVEIANVSRYGFDPHEQTVNLSFTNCVARDNGVDGFTIDFCSAVTLMGNVAYGNGRHGFNIVTGSHDVVMTDNEAYGNGGSGIAVQTGDNEARSFTGHVTISGGSVHDNGRLGIEVKQATDIAIDNVAVSGNAQGGISLRGVENVELSANTVGGNGGQAIKIDGYLQTFGDADPLNDRYIATHNVTIDGVLQPDPAVPPGVTLWSWSITAGDDTITGSAGADRFAAGSGNDMVSGLAGNDVVFGGDGNDRLDGGAGSDMLYGGAQNDTLVYSVGGVDILDGGSGFDTIDFSGMVSAVYVNLGVSGVDAWTSGTSIAVAANATTSLAEIAAAEAIVGTSFSDQMIGNGSANTLIGGAGADNLSGAGGVDRLDGGAGNDLLNGGSGNDVFVFNAGWGRDTIQDFARGKDKIELSGIAGLTSFSQLSIANVVGKATVTFGTDSITLNGVTAGQLGASDFIFS